MSFWRKAKEQDQRAARHDKMARKGRQDPQPYASHSDRANGARTAAKIYRDMAKQEESK